MASGTGSAVPFVETGGRGHGKAVARVLALGGAGKAGAGPCRVVAAPWQAGAVRKSR